jgi:hypothetical protein
MNRRKSIGGSSSDPVKRFVINLGNMLGDQLLAAIEPVTKQALSDLMPPTQQSQHELDSFQTARDLEQAELAKAKANAYKAEQEAKLAAQKAEEYQNRHDDHRQDTPSVSIERTEMDLHYKHEIIGLKGIEPRLYGFAENDGKNPEMENWFEHRFGTVTLILGALGTGKTATGAGVGEHLQARFKVPFLWLGLPDWAQAQLPPYVRIIHGLEEVSNDSFVLVDEAGLTFNSLNFNSPTNVFLRKFLVLARQRNLIVVFCCQNSSDLDLGVLRGVSTIIYKEPALLSAGCERGVLKDWTAKAKEVFAKIPEDKKKSTSCIFDSRFEAVITNDLPSFWCDEISCAYGRPDPKKISNQANNQTAVTDDQIWEKRRQGWGIDKIQTHFGCSQYRVRQTLAKFDPLVDQDH